MNSKNLIFQLIILFLNLPAIAQKIPLSNLEDSLINVISSYEFYVSDLDTKRPEVIVLNLPSEIGTLDKGSYVDSYFDEKQAINLYRNNDKLLMELNNILNKEKNEINKKIKAYDLENMLTPVGYRSLQTHSIKDYVFYFIDPRICPQNSERNKDILSVLACKDRFKRMIQDSLFAIRNDIKSIIYSNNYNSKTLGSNDVPIQLKFLLNLSLQRAKNHLPRSKHSIIKQTKLYYDNPKKENTMLWVSSHNNSIYISPFLIRATFFYTLNQYSLFKFLLNNYNKIKNESLGKFGPSPESEFIRKHRPEVKNAMHGFYEDFITNFTFVIAHELAHIYNHDTAGLQAEIRSDCYALQSLKNGKKQINLGVFQAILKDAIDRNLEGVWGVKDLGILKKRFQFINGYLNEGTDCETIDFKTLNQ